MFESEKKLSNILKVFKIIIIIIIITRAYLNWLVRTGRYNVWRDKSPKAAVTSFIVQIQVVGLAYWLP